MPRCSYKEGRARCPKNGTHAIGDDDFCRAHYLVMNDAGIPGGSLRVNPVDRALEVGREAIEDLLSGKPLDAAKIKSALSDLGIGAGWNLGGAYAGYQPDIPHDPPADPFAPLRDAWNRTQGRQQRQAGPDQIDAADLARAQKKARQVLGFGPTDAIDAETLKRVHRKMVIKHHPDRGGNPQRMAEINAARDILAATL